MAEGKKIDRRTFLAVSTGTVAGALALGRGGAASTKEDALSACPAVLGAWTYRPSSGPICTRPATATCTRPATR